jgi:hypothetical protein
MADFDPTPRELLWWKLSFAVPAGAAAFLKFILYPNGNAVLDIMLAAVAVTIGFWLGSVIAEHRALARWHRQAKDRARPPAK